MSPRTPAEAARRSCRGTKEILSLFAVSVKEVEESDKLSVRRIRRLKMVQHLVALGRDGPSSGQELSTSQDMQISMRPGMEGPQYEY